jgi:hypothetical protein
VPPSGRQHEDVASAPHADRREPSALELEAQPRILRRHRLGQAKAQRRLAAIGQLEIAYRRIRILAPNAMRASLHD